MPSKSLYITHHWIPLEDDYSASLVTSGQKVPVVIEFHAGDDVG